MFENIAYRCFKVELTELYNPSIWIQFMLTSHESHSLYLYFFMINYYLQVGELLTYFYWLTQVSKNKSAYRFFSKLSFIFFVPFFHFSFILLWRWSIYSLIHSLILLFSFITIIIIFTLLPLTSSLPQKYFFSLFNLMFYLYSIYYIRYFQLQCFV